MRSFILLIVIGLLALIGKTIPIKLLEQPAPKNSFAQLLTEAPGKEYTPSDLSASLEGFDAHALMKGETEAVFNTFKAGAEVVSGILESKDLTGNLAKLAKGLSALSFALPIASIALELFLGKQSDPMLVEISNKLDSLSAKVDTYQKDTMQAFKGLEAIICEEALTPSRATL